MIPDSVIFTRLEVTVDLGEEALSTIPVTP